MKIDLSATVGKCLIPFLIIGGVLFYESSYGFYLGQILWYPFSFFLRIEPLVCSDKPWFASRYGAVFAAAVWSAMLYCAVSVRRKE
jgi:hypothetical protein